jgi:hypothetical protein
MTTEQKNELQNKLIIASHEKKDDGIFLMKTGGITFLSGICLGLTQIIIEESSIALVGSLVILAGAATCAYGTGKYLNGKRLESRIPDYDDTEDDTELEKLSRSTEEN